MSNVTNKAKIMLKNKVCVNKIILLVSLIIFVCLGFFYQARQLTKKQIVYKSEASENQSNQLTNLSSNKLKITGKVIVDYKTPVDWVDVRIEEKIGNDFQSINYCTFNQKKPKNSQEYSFELPCISWNPFQRNKIKDMFTDLRVIAKAGYDGPGRGSEGNTYILSCEGDIEQAYEHEARCILRAPGYVSFYLTDKPLSVTPVPLEINMNSSIIGQLIPSFSLNLPVKKVIVNLERLNNNNIWIRNPDKDSSLEFNVKNGEIYRFRFSLPDNVKYRINSQLVLEDKRVIDNFVTHFTLCPGKIEKITELKEYCLIENLKEVKMIVSDRVLYNCFAGNPCPANHECIEMKGEGSFRHGTCVLRE